MSIGCLLTIEVSTAVLELARALVESDETVEDVLKSALIIGLVAMAEIEGEEMGDTDAGL